MKLSMMTYTMARQKYSVEDIVKTAAELEMEGIDWVSTYGRDPNELKRMSDDAGLPVVCYTFGLRSFVQGGDAWQDEAKQGVEDAVALDAPVVMIPTSSNPEIGRDEFRRRWIDALARIVPLTDAAGIVLTVENFPGLHSAFVTAADFAEAKREIPQLKLTYDNGNAAGGEDPVESFRACAEDVVHVHFKDWYIRDEAADGYMAMLTGKHFKSALIGEGDIDTVGCWNALHEHGYDGYVNIEYEGNDVPADEAIARVVKYLRGLPGE